MSNPSREVMRRSVERHLTDLERMREFDRGYRAGKAAMSAEHNMLHQSRKNGDNCKVEASDSVESSKYAGNCKSGHSRTCPESGDEVSESAPSVSITDELRECVERATKTYDDTAWYDVDDGNEHTWCSITVAEINAIAARIEQREDELRRKTAEAQGLRHECSTYRDMLLIASDELGSIKKHLDEIVEVLDGRD